MVRMNLDFHYYGTYCAARLAGYERAQAVEIAYYAQFVDECSETLLRSIPIESSRLVPTVQSDKEMSSQLLDPHDYTPQELKKVCEIWSPFHFLPGNTDDHISDSRLNRIQAIELRRLCQTDSPLVERIVENAKVNGSLAAIGMTMHILADTWAHCYFAGIPAKYINDATGDVFELSGGKRTKLTFMYDPIFPDNLSKNHYSCSPINPIRDRSIVYLGHGRMGHLPDYGFMKYAYCPVWRDGQELIKDNPQFFLNAFCQMITAMQYIRGSIASFHTDVYAQLGNVTEQQIKNIIQTRKIESSAEWQAFIADGLSGEDSREGAIPVFQAQQCISQYLAAQNKEATGLVQFLDAAKAHVIEVNRAAGAYPVVYTS